MNTTRGNVSGSCKASSMRGRRQTRAQGLGPDVGGSWAAARRRRQRERGLAEPAKLAFASL
jgi:hypothetical protein